MNPIDGQAVAQGKAFFSLFWGSNLTPMLVNLLVYLDQTSAIWRKKRTLQMMTLMAFKIFSFLQVSRF